MLFPAHTTCQFFGTYLNCPKECVKVGGGIIHGLIALLCKDSSIIDRGLPSLFTILTVPQEIFLLKAVICYTIK